MVNANKQRREALTCQEQKQKLKKKNDARIKDAKNIREARRHDRKRASGEWPQRL
jgi:hypothetical protein